MIIKRLTFTAAFIPVLTLMIFSCSTHMTPMSENQRSYGHYRLYSYPSPKESFVSTLKQVEKSNRYKSLLVVNISEPNVLLNETSSLLKGYMNKEPQSVKKGGKDILFKYLTNIQAYFKRSYYLTSAYSDEIINYFDFMQPHSVYINNKSLEEQKINKNSHSKAILSNIYSIKTLERIEDESITSYNLTIVNDIKIGHISLVAPKSLKAQTFKQNSLFQKSFLKTVETELVKIASILRQKGAEVIIASISGFQVDCSSNLKDISHFKVNFHESFYESCSEKNSTFTKIISTLPNNLINLFILDSHNSKSANIINESIILQGLSGESHLQLALIIYDKELQKVSIEKSSPLQPLELCHHFFESTLDCFTEESIKDSTLIPASVFGLEI